MACRQPKCSETVVIHELLAFVQQKLDVMDQVSLEQILMTSFTEDEIIQAKKMLADSAVTQIRLITRHRDGRDLDHIADWCDQNNVVLNPIKSKYMLLGTQNQTNTILTFNPQINIKSNPLERVLEGQNLGLVMAGRLRFEGHVQETMRYCFYRLKVLYQIREYLTVNVRIRLCEALILSKLTHADTVFGECLLVRTKRLIQRVQNACERFYFTK
ncbi:unnamed protein product [Parnassius mnemosyne]|uniref:Uncharacterized protein n=1 Tax=Parnassius mnemosyne TaxID=213953 RepID=A0AAV1LFC8_9NEOP